MKLYFSSTLYSDSTSESLPSILDDYYTDPNYNDLINHLMTFYILNTSHNDHRDEIFNKKWKLLCLDCESKQSYFLTLDDPFVKNAYLDAKKLAMLL